MPKIPLVKSGNQQIDLWQTRAKSLIDPILTNKIVQGVYLANQSLAPGSNTINHTLGRTPQGWFEVDKSGPAIIWRSGAFNSSTLILTSSATATITVSLWVF